MRVTFARDMKVDEAMATPLQERLHASRAPHFPSLYLLLLRRDVALEKDAAGCTSPPSPSVACLVQSAIKRQLSHEPVNCACH